MIRMQINLRFRYCRAGIVPRSRDMDSRYYFLVLITYLLNPMRKGNGPAGKRMSDS